MDIIIFNNIILALKNFKNVFIHTETMCEFMNEINNSDCNIELNFSSDAFIKKSNLDCYNLIIDNISTNLWYNIGLNPEILINYIKVSDINDISNYGDFKSPLLELKIFHKSMAIKSFW